MSDSMPSTSPCEPNSDDGHNTPPQCKVCGKGKGGAGAKYCTMSPWKQKEQFLGRSLSVCTNDLGIEALWCDACGCPVSHKTKSTVQGHCQGFGGAYTITRKPHFPSHFWPNFRHFLRIFLHFFANVGNCIPPPLGWAVMCPPDKRGPTVSSQLVN